MSRVLGELLCKRKKFGFLPPRLPKPPPTFRTKNWGGVEEGEGGGMCLVVCVWWYVFGGMCLVVCCLLLALVSIFLRELRLCKKGEFTAPPRGKWLMGLCWRMFSVPPSTHMLDASDSPAILHIALLYVYLRVLRSLADSVGCGDWDARCLPCCTPPACFPLTQKLPHLRLHKQRPAPP